MKKGFIVLVVALSFSVIINARFLYNRYTIIGSSKIGAAMQLKVDSNRKAGKIALYNSLPIDSNDKVFIGTSITEGFPIEEMFGPSYKNRGISGGVVADMRAIAPHIADGQPGVIYIEVGINDLKNELPNVQQEEEPFIDSLGRLVEYLKLHSPGSRLFLQSLLPVNETYFHESTKTMNESILRTNKMLFSLAQRERIVFVDTYPAFAINNRMPDSLTVDGLHLNEKGYSVLSLGKQTSIRPLE